MQAESARSRTARRAAAAALVRVVHHYGERPDFVVLGGLVPELLCTGSGARHAGTTDIDVQVDPAIAAGATTTRRLEQALGNAEFSSSDEGRIWRWTADIDGGAIVVVKFELLADLEHEPAQSTVVFDECEALGAINLRGTGFAARDHAPVILSSRIDGVFCEVEVNVTRLAGYLLAKTAAAYGRRLPKDFYDLACVLLHDDRGGPPEAAAAVRERFSGDLVGGTRTALDELLAVFSSEDGKGAEAYASQFAFDHPERVDAEEQLRADAVFAVRIFHRGLFG